jgi:hypothetical protein
VISELAAREPAVSLRITNRATPKRVGVRTGANLFKGRRSKAGEKRIDPVSSLTRIYFYIDI